MTAIGQGIPLATSAATSPSPEGQLNRPAEVPRHPILERGFRPFFLLASVLAVAMMGVWLAQLTGLVRPQSYYGAYGWHAHEMMFGYAVAVIAGFLLTAVGNWTGLATLRGVPLLGLALIWIAARLVHFVALPLPGAFVAAADVAFLPALAIALAKPLWSARNVRNLIFPALLLGLATVNGVIHLAMHSVMPSVLAVARELSLLIPLILIAIVGGRIIPLFTRKALGIPDTHRSTRLVDGCALGGLIVLVVTEIFAMSSLAVAAAAAFAAIANGWRLVGWYRPAIWGNSLLWVLHVAYAWLVAGLALKVFATLGVVPGSIAVHAWTVGCLGTATLGMMVRVTLGHTGRVVSPQRIMSVAFGLVNAAALVRMCVYILPADWYAFLLTGSGVLWMLAFLLFVVRFGPMLVSPRIDARAG